MKGQITMGYAASGSIKPDIIRLDEKDEKPNECSDDSQDARTPVTETNEFDD